MGDSTSTIERAVGQYHELRMSADKLLAIADEGSDYEMIDKVFILPPSPTPQHQHLREQRRSVSSRSIGTLPAPHSGRIVSDANSLGL